MENISVVSFNVRGLRNTDKRRSIFRHLHIAYGQSIILLQETHSCPELEKVWRSEWGGDIEFSHGSDSAQAGVAVLFPPGRVNKVEIVYSDDQGRLICLNVNCASGDVLLLSVYAPAANNQGLKCEFLELLRDVLLAHSNVRTIVGGDFNIKLGPLDTDQPVYKSTNSAKKLQNLIDEFELSDVWRIQHPTTRRFTWRRTTPLQQSRIDLIFISETMFCNEVVQSKIEPGILSDHSFSFVSMECSTEKRGPGIWRFNNELLQCEAFAESVRHEIGLAKLQQGCYAGAHWSRFTKKSIKNNF